MTGTILVHAWRLLPDDSQESCDMSDNPDGFSVCTRIETPEDDLQPFDIVDEMDFSTLAEAMAEAETRAAQLGLSIDQF